MPDQLPSVEIHVQWPAHAGHDAIGRTGLAVAGEGADVRERQCLLGCRFLRAVGGAAGKCEGNGDGGSGEQDRFHPSDSF